MDRIRVLVVDDHPVVRHGLRSLLANHDDIQIVGEAGSASEAFQMASSAHPDVVLLDIRMPGYSGIDVAQQLRRAHPTLRVLILTAYEDDEYLFGALRAGAHGYLLKSSSHDVLASAIRAVHRGERLLSPGLVDRVLKEFEDLAKERAHHESGLSDQELQVLRHIAEGATNKEIAERMFWSEVTVKRKVEDIFAKLNVANRAQAVAEAIRRGLI